MTEVSDELRRENELLAKDNNENSHWIDNQQHLMDQCNDLADVIRQRDVEIRDLKIKLTVQPPLMLSKATNTNGMHPNKKKETA